MNRLFFLLTALVIFSQALHSQVVMIPQSPTHGLIPKQQVFSVLVNNLSGGSQQAVLVVQIIDAAGSQLVLELVSAPFTIHGGVRRITYQDLQPFTSSNASHLISADLSVSESLPFGQYKICYRLMNSASKGELLSAECIKVISEPLVPPQLIDPETDATVGDIRPTFTWTPPAPLHLFTDLNYEITVSRLYANQSPEEAIRRNIPVLKYHIANPALAYPASYENLLEGQQYVWQVVAEEKGRPVAESEVWTFKVLPDSIRKIISMSPFVKLSLGSSEVAVSHEGFIKMEYFHTAQDSVVTISVKNIDPGSKRRKQEMSFTVPVVAGQNLIEYNIGKKLRLDENSVYQVVLYNQRGEQWVMKISPKYY